jgi:hypothetical protein
MYFLIEFNCQFYHPVIIHNYWTRETQLDGKVVDVYSVKDMHNINDHYYG